MEYLEGQTLKDRLADRPLPLKEFLKTASEVAETLEKAHAAGIIHRDLKPGNIMLTPEGHAMVMDFGLAKQVISEEEGTQDLSSTLTHDGAVVGTLSYMSPEQVRSDPADHRTDIFSFGVVLYQMLTGVHPFRRDKAVETTSAILYEEPAPLSGSLEQVPELL
jgi:serine/threonine protein kinase